MHIEAKCYSKDLQPVFMQRLEKGVDHGRLGHSAHWNAEWILVCRTGTGILGIPLLGDSFC